LSAISIIEVKKLTKVFDNRLTAVDHISFDVQEGEIFGFLGPNGAGKTTTLNMLATLLRPTSGNATVDGHDILKDPDAVRHSIGFVFQDPTLDTELTGRENLDFHGRIYGIKADVREKRIKEMLGVVQLSDRADELVKTYSGGMKRRLEIARGLLHYPRVLFLDEPTLGLDPQTRRAIWDYIERLNQQENVTIILTTHYTEEADQLCDRIQIIDFGKIVALDTAENLKARLQGDVVTLSFKEAAMVPKVRHLLEGKDWIRRIDAMGAESNHGGMARMMQMMRGMSGGGGMGGMMSGMGTEAPAMSSPMAKKMKGMPPHAMAGEIGPHGVDEGATRLNLLVDDGGHRIPEIVKLVDAAGVAVDSVELHKPTLDDVFLSVTGRSIRDERGSFMEGVRRNVIVQSARGRRMPG
jgi:ABC-2 type transport system ATP-binding protein